MYNLIRVYYSPKTNELVTYIYDRTSTINNLNDSKFMRLAGFIRVHTFFEWSV